MSTCVLTVQFRIQTLCVNYWVWNLTLQTFTCQLGNIVEQEPITRFLSGANFLDREEAERVTKSREVYPCSAGNIRDLNVFFWFEVAVRSGVQCHVTHLTQRTPTQDHSTVQHQTIRYNSGWVNKHAKSRRGNDPPHPLQKYRTGQTTRKRKTPQSE